MQREQIILILLISNVHQRQIYSSRMQVSDTWELVAGNWGDHNRHKGSLWGWRECSNNATCQWLHTLVSLTKTLNHILKNGWILWCIHYSSINLTYTEGSSLSQVLLLFPFQGVGNWDSERLVSQSHTGSDVATWFQTCDRKHRHLLPFLQRLLGPILCYKASL